jgi:hypothetical protein
MEKKYLASSKLPSDEDMDSEIHKRLLTRIRNHIKDIQSLLDLLPDYPLKDMSVTMHRGGVDPNIVIAAEELLTGIVGDKQPVNSAEDKLDEPTYESGYNY